MTERRVPLNYSPADLAADNATLEKILSRSWCQKRRHRQQPDCFNRGEHSTQFTMCLTDWRGTINPKALEALVKILKTENNTVIARLATGADIQSAIDAANLKHAYEALKPKPNQWAELAARYDYLRQHHEIPKKSEIKECTAWNPNCFISVR